MAIDKFTKNMDIIAALDNEPNDTGGLTAEQLKEKFDEGGNAIKAYLNETVAPAIDRQEADAAALKEVKHTHGNKALLDTYAQTEENLADAVAKKHSHHNKAVLDGIAAVTQELGAEPDRVPSEAAVSAAIASAGNLPAGGVAGQALVKKSDTAYDTQWDTLTAARVGAAPAGMVHLATYTELSHIGVTKGSETMVSIAQAMPDNSILEVSCGDGNNSAADGTAFPVVSGGAARYGILRVTKTGGNDRVSFEFRVKEKNARVFTGFYSSADGWSGWKKVYTEGSKPALNELVDTVPINLGGTGKKTAAEALAALGGITAAQVGGIHIWRRRDAAVVPYGDSVEKIIAESIPNTSATRTIEYYNAYVQDGTVQLALAGSVDLSVDNIQTVGVALRGHWFKNTAGEVFYAPADSYLYGEKQGAYTYRLIAKGQKPEVVATDSFTVLSGESGSEYPKNAYSGAYYYEYIGTVGGSHVRVSVGSYAGSGRSGPAHPNRLTFDFTPQAIFLYCGAYIGKYEEYATGAARTAVGTRGFNIRSFLHYGSNGNSWGLETTWGANYIEWSDPSSSESDDTILCQMNDSDFEYCYIVVGW